MTTQNTQSNGGVEPEETQTKTFSLCPTPEWLKAHGFPTNPTVAEIFGAALAGTLEFRREAIEAGYSPEYVRCEAAEEERDAFEERFSESSPDSAFLKRHELAAWLKNNLN
jgi:CRISPR/Cas system-associated exonuclease Cas4 (RecB family)